MDGIWENWVEPRDGYRHSSTPSYRANELQERDIFASETDAVSIINKKIRDKFDAQQETYQPVDFVVEKMELQIILLNFLTR